MFSSLDVWVLSCHDVYEHVQYGYCNRALEPGCVDFNERAICWPLLGARSARISKVCCGVASRCNALSTSVGLERMYPRPSTSLVSRWERGRI